MLSRSASRLNVRLQSFDICPSALRDRSENQLSDLRTLLHSTRQLASRASTLRRASTTAPPVAVSDAELPGTLVSEEDAAKVEPVPDQNVDQRLNRCSPSPAKRPAPVAASTPAAAPPVAVYRRNGYHAGGNGYRRRRMAGAASGPTLPPISVTQNAGPIPGLPATTPRGRLICHRRSASLSELARLAPDWAVATATSWFHSKATYPLAGSGATAGAAVAAAAECWRIARGKSYRLVGGLQQLQRLADQLNALDEQGEVPDGERTRKPQYLPSHSRLTALFRWRAAALQPAGRASR